MFKTLMFGAPWVLLMACDDPHERKEGRDDGYALTEPDARKALDQVNEASRPDAVTAEVIDVSTDITIGDRIDLVADRWRAFWESQAPCNQVTFDGNVVTVDFGTLDDACTYGGDTYAGRDTITLTQITDAGSDLRVDHVWTGFTNGLVRIDGQTGVYWSGEGLRHAEIDYTVANAETGTVVDVYGQHTVSRLDAELPAADGGFQLDGRRTWDDGSGAWNVELNDLAMLIDDASPFDGDAVVTAPDGRELTVEYSRVDEDTTRAVVTGPGGEQFDFHITAEGELDVDE